MPDLGRFQDAFMAALAGDARSLSPWLDGEAPGLDVHRNTSLKGAIDALEANFPGVAGMVGTEWFRAAAREFARTHPPRAAALHAYGEGFAEWLAEFPPATSLPYLPGAACLDRLWLEALLAADAQPLCAEDMARLDEEDLAHTIARLHPTVRLAWSFDNSPSLWLQTRWPAEPLPEMAFLQEPQGVAISRPDDAVRARIIDAAGFTFLDACRRGRPLAEAASAALETSEDADLAGIMAAALEHGLFAALEVDECP